MKRYFIIIIAVLTVSTLYILALATGNANALSEYFWWVLGASCFILLIIVSMILQSSWQLIRSLQNREFGSQIARKLAIRFTLIAILPGLFLFGVSAQFIGHSINSWFGNNTEEALERSLNLSKSALTLSLDNTVKTATGIQIQLIARASLGQSVEPLIESLGQSNQLSQLILWELGKNEPFMQYNPDTLPLPVLSISDLTKLQEGGSIAEISNINNKLFSQGWLLLPAINSKTYALFFREQVPPKVAEDASLIESARSKYAELRYAKQGLQTFFMATLLMATLLAIAFALLTALLFSQNFAEPILLLARSAQRVAKGDLSKQIPVNRTDELGDLQRLFNHMTTQLQHAHHQQEMDRLYLEHILNSLTIGVITLDRDGFIKTYNHTAESILRHPIETYKNHHWQSLFSGSPTEIAIAEVLAAIIATEFQHNPKQINYHHQDESRILLGKANSLPTENGTGSVLVFDDVTELVYAQKEAAWGEVAQRLAHEIRNPLTPIQLSAERLARKLNDKLDQSDQTILNKATQTIIHQVAAMKDMVEAFRNYARSPRLNLSKFDLNELIREILLLYEANSCTFYVNLSNISLCIQADAGALRQVIHNLLKNATEAASEAEQPMVTITTQQQDKLLVLNISNNGKNFSKDMLLRAFDPYVTDKPTGTGLGLPVVKKIIEEHGGSIQLFNQDTTGCACVRLTLTLLVNDDEKQ